jgi:hypothetical protein
MDAERLGAKLAEAVFYTALDAASQKALEYICKQVRRNSPVLEQQLLYECDSRLDHKHCRPHCCLDKQEEDSGQCVSEQVCALQRQCIQIL